VKNISFFKKNIFNYNNITAYNYALGNENLVKKLYFIKNKSAQASIYKENCEYNLGNKKKIS